MILSRGLKVTPAPDRNHKIMKSPHGFNRAISANFPNQQNHSTKQAFDRINRFFYAGQGRTRGEDDSKVAREGM